MVLGPDWGGFRKPNGPCLKVNNGNIRSTPVPQIAGGAK